MERKQIKGRIDFLITIENGHVNTDYTTSAENDIAALAISELILRDTANQYEQQLVLVKQVISSKASPVEKLEAIEKKKFFANMYNVLNKSRKGCIKILDFLLENYDGFKQEVAEKDKKSEEIMNYLKENATVEEGVLSEEEAIRLLGDKYKDLKKDSSGDENNK